VPADNGDATREQLARARAVVAARSDAPAGRAPPDPGELLAEVDRPDGTRLRVAWRTLEGRPFVTVAVWEPGAHGGWWPVKGKQVSVRRAELGAVLEGLILAAEKASGWTP
jgi:hypothetical protein